MFERYVAIGDSTTEGLDDPDGNGGYRGWANRFADLITAHQGQLLYANLGVRGRRTREVLENQLELALAMRPDLSTVVSGTNDVLHPRFDADVVGRDIHHMQRLLIQQGATVLTFTLPDLSRVNPAVRFLAPRILALNAVLRAVATETGAVVVDVAQYEVASDPRMWSRDRLHANSLGHARIADALAHAIELPGSSMAWTEPLDSTGIRATTRITDDLAWAQTYLLPWIRRRMRGVSSGTGVRCKRPELAPVEGDTRPG